jgi:hypothetical protein
VLPLPETEPGSFTQARSLVGTCTTIFRLSRFGENEMNDRVEEDNREKRWSEANKMEDRKCRAMHWLIVGL